MIALLLALLIQDPDPLLKRLDAAKLQGRELKFVDGSAGFLLRDGVALCEGDLRKFAWADVDPVCVGGLVKASATETAEFLLRCDRVAEAHAILESWLAEDVGRKPKVDEVLSKAAGIATIEWGYDAKLKFLHPAAKKEIEDWRRALARPDEVEAMAADAKYGDDFRAELKRLAERNARLKPAREAEKIIASPEFRKGVAEAKKTIGALRKSVVKLIEDERAYSEKDHGKKGQPKVDEAVNKMTPAWGAAFVDAIAAPDEVKRRVRAAAIQEIRGKPHENFAATALFKPPDGTPAEAIDEACVLNGYRAMLGRAPLTFDGRLMKSAQKHTANMAKEGGIYHDGADGTVVSRLAAEGYTGPIGENVQGGGETPAAAHANWYRSPGHHRNMINDKFTIIGVGYVEGYWTQCFGQ